MLGEDPGDEGYEDPYDEEGSTVQTIILPGNDMVTNNKPDSRGNPASDQLLLFTLPLLFPFRFFSFEKSKFLHLAKSLHLAKYFQSPFSRQFSKLLQRLEIFSLVTKNMF